MEPLNKEQLASRYGVTKRTVERFVVDGLPHTGARKSLRFDPPEADAWLANHARRRKPLPAVHSSHDVTNAVAPSRGDQMSFDEAARRKMAAEALQKEIQVAKSLGQTISISDAKRIWDERVVEARQALLNAPAKIVQRLGLDANDSRRLLELLTQEFADILHGLAGDNA
jgi:phage terminase Nu1 subunit (DNA packaging protein)